MVRSVTALTAVLAVSAALLTGCGQDEHGRNCPGNSGKDLSHRSVAGPDLATQVPLVCASFERSTLTGPVSAVNLSRADLYGAQMSGTSMENVDLRGADLRHATFASAQLSQVDLRGADLSTAVLSKSILTNVGFGGARLRDTDLRATFLNDVDFSDADLQGADLTGATFTDSNLRGARLDSAQLSGIRWGNVVCPDGSKSGDSCAGHLTPASPSPSRSTG